jgi:thioredoxin reductase
LPDWGPTTFFVNNAFVPTALQLAQLRDRGVSVETASVVRIGGARADIELCDGRVVALAGLFTVSRTAPASPLAAQIGCAIADGPLGPFIETDVFKEATVAGVFACGDAARPIGSVAFAVADGAMAGAMAHQSLIFRAS